MQAKLLEAVAGQGEATRKLQEAQQASDSERAHLEQLVRRSKEEGTVRIQTLEETIRKLGNRSDLHQVGCLSCLYHPLACLTLATALAETLPCLLAAPGECMSVVIHLGEPLDATCEPATASHPQFGINAKQCQVLERLMTPPTCRNHTLFEMTRSMSAHEMTHGSTQLTQGAFSRRYRMTTHTHGTA